MRDCSRDWRRFQEEKIVKNRLKKFNYSFGYFLNPLWIESIGTSDHFIYRNMTTKYKNRYRDETRYKRFKYKKEFLDLLKYEGIL